MSSSGAALVARCLAEAKLYLQEIEPFRSDFKQSALLNHTAIVFADVRSGCTTDSSQTARQVRKVPRAAP